MKVSKTFYNIKCDCCGQLLDPESYWQEKETLDLLFSETGFRHLGDKDYCPNCQQWDDDDNLVTKDGRKFNGETYEEIL